MQKIFLKYGNNIKSSEQLTDIIEYTFFCMYTVSQKNIPDVFSYNSQKHCRIFIIFGRNITEKSDN